MSSIRKMKFGTTFTVFVLFFGIGALEISNSNCQKAAFWLAIAVMFLLADNLRKSPASV